MCWLGLCGVSSDGKPAAHRMGVGGGGDCRPPKIRRAVGCAPSSCKAVEDTAAMSS